MSQFELSGILLSQGFTCSRVLQQSSQSKSQLSHVQQGGIQQETKPSHPRDKSVIQSQRELSDKVSPLAQEHSPDKSKQKLGRFPGEGDPKPFNFGKKKKQADHDRVAPLTSKAFPCSVLNIKSSPWLLLPCHSPEDTEIMVIHGAQAIQCWFYCNINIAVI